LGEVKEAAKRGQVISGAVYFSRDLASTPSNEMTPTILPEGEGIGKKESIK